MTVHSAAGFTFVEALMAVVLLATTVTTMSVALEHVRAVNERNDDVATATHLLQDGIARARLLRRTGTASGSGTANTATIVEDLDGIGESGPTDLAGTAFSTEWKRTWSVSSANLDAPMKDAAASSTTLLRVSVTVWKNGVETAAESFLLSKTP